MKLMPGAGPGHRGVESNGLLRRGRLRAAGATPVQVILHAILPQVLPQMADTVIYRWEYHFRASVVLGAVGAGGIGTELLSSLRIMDYPQVSAILICILACVTVVDAIGMALRRRLK